MRSLSTTRRGILNWLLAFNGNWWTHSLLANLCFFSIGGQYSFFFDVVVIAEEEVIYFNQSLPTSNSIQFIFYSEREKWKKESQRVRDETKQMVMALICIIIVPLINFSSSSSNIAPKEINENLFFDFDPRGDNLYANQSLPARRCDHNNNNNNLDDVRKRSENYVCGK